MATVPKIGARKVIQIAAVGLSGKPLMLNMTKPATENEDSSVEQVVLPSINDVGIVALCDDGTMWFRSFTSAWVQVPNVDDDLAMSQEELEAEARKLGLVGG